MYFVNQRWLGGLLTNFSTIQRSLARLKDLEAMETDGRYESLSKKEIAQLEKEKRKLQKNLEGIRHMQRPHRNRELRHVHRVADAQPMLAHMLDMLGPRVDERHILARLRHVGAGIPPDRARPDDGYLVAHGLLRS